MSLEELLIHGQGINVHRKYINTLLTEIYKTFSGENPYFMKSISTKKRSNIQSKNFKSLNPTQNKYKKVWSFSFCASHLWNQLPDHVKYKTSAISKRF